MVYYSITILTPVFLMRRVRDVSPGLYLQSHDLDPGV